MSEGMRRGEICKTRGGDGKMERKVSKRETVWHLSHSSGLNTQVHHQHQSDSQKHKTVRSEEEGKQRR